MIASLLLPLPIDLDVFKKYNLFGLTIIIGSLWLYRKQLGRILYLILLSLIGGGFCLMQYSQLIYPKSEYYEHYSGQALVTRAEQRHGQQRLTLNINKYQIITTINAYPKYYFGDVVEIEGDISRLEPFRADNGQVVAYDKIMLATRRVVGQIRLQASPRIVGQHSGNKLFQQIDLFKRQADLLIKYFWPMPEAALGEGLIFGDKADFSRKFSSALSATGTSHIVAISGYNVAILLVICFILMRKIIGFKPAVIISISGLVAFVILTGATASVVRAAVMGLVLIIAKVVGRPTNIGHSLFIAGLLMIILNPFIIGYDLGFQLSFIAVLGLIYLMPVIVSLANKFFKTMIGQILAATLSAQIAVAPILITSFGNVSILAPLVNALILPFIPAITLIVIGILCTGMLIPTLGGQLAWIGWYPLHLIIKTIEIFGQLSWAQIIITNVPRWTIVLWWGGLAVVIWRFNIARRRRSASKI